MPIGRLDSFLIILVAGIATFLTRVAPFVLFPKGKQIPSLIQYLGKVLTPAIIGMLLVFFLRQTPIVSYPYGIPELIAIAITVTLHLWKRNTLISIGVGTALYMVLVQVVF
jgi:branched-subunit amino acid transport protein AzlD